MPIRSLKELEGDKDFKEDDDSDSPNPMDDFVQNIHDELDKDAGEEIEEHIARPIQDFLSPQVRKAQELIEQAKKVMETPIETVANDPFIEAMERSFEEQKFIPIDDMGTLRVPTVDEMLKANVAQMLPIARGRHIGNAALSTIARQVGTGLQFIKPSSEFVVYDGQPPPVGEYTIQPFHVSQLEYGGTVQNHLLVTFKEGQLTGFGMEDSYAGFEQELGIETDYLINLESLLENRDGRTLVLNYNRNIQVKYNATDHTPLSLYSIQSPYIIDLGLNLTKLYITTTQATKIRMQVW